MASSGNRHHANLNWHTFVSYYTGQSALAGTHSLQLEDFNVAKFYCLCVLTGGIYHIWIMEKTSSIEFVVLQSSAFIVWLAYIL